MPLNSAVVGAGVVSDVHFRGLAACPHTDLVAVCDLDEDRAREAAREHVVTPYTDLGEMLASEDPDWVHVCTPVQTHRDLGVQCLEAGAHVLLEKPATVTTGEFEDLAAAAEANGVTLSVVHNHNFSPGMRRLGERVEAGEIGDVRAVNMIYPGSSRPDDVLRGAWSRELVGGEFEEGLPHPIYPVLKAGGYPRDHDSVRATTAIHGRYDREYAFDGAQAQWVTEDEVLCSVQMLAGSVPEWKMSVHGEEKSLTLDFVSQTILEHDRDYLENATNRGLNNVDEILDRVRGSVEMGTSFVKSKLRSDWDTQRSMQSHFAQFDAEVRYLVAGGDPAVPVEEGYWEVGVLEAIRETARGDQGARQRTREAVDAVESDEAGEQEPEAAAASE